MSFCGYLKQSTTATISLGPFVDKDDGDTEKTGLTVEDTDVYLSKNGGAKANPNDTNNCTEDANGIYRKQLDGTDTGTLGILTVYVHFTDCMYIKQDYQVVMANWYDTMCSSDQLDVNVTNIEGSDATTQLESACTSSLDTYDPPTKTEMDTGFAALNDISSGDVETACGAALTSYDPPTRAELTSDKNAIITEVDANETKIDALNDLSSADVETACGSALTTYDPPTRAELTTDKNSIITEIDANETKIDALNDLSSADVQTACGNALTTYDPPTKTEMDTAHSTTDGKIDALNNISAADVWNATVDEATAGATPTTAKGKLQALWNRSFKKKTVTATAEKSYEKDDSTEMATWTLSDDDTTATRTPD